MIKLTKTLKFRFLRYINENLMNILSPAFFVILWELLVYLGVLNPSYFPSPSKIFIRLIELFQTGELVTHTVATVYRLFFAFILAAVPGIAIGLLMGLSKTIRSIVDPIIALIYPIPKVAMLPLFMVIFGLGTLPIVVTAFITAFFIIILNTLAGVLNIDKVLFEAARNYGAKGWRLFIKVVLPGAMPMIFTGLRLGLGMSLIVVVASEFIATQSGLGYLIYISWRVLRVEDMYVGFVVTGILGYMVTRGLEKLSDKLMPWREEKVVI